MSPNGWIIGVRNLSVIVRKLGEGGAAPGEGFMFGVLNQTGVELRVSGPKGVPRVELRVSGPKAVARSLVPW